MAIVFGAMVAARYDYGLCPELEVKDRSRVLENIPPHLR